MNQSETTGVRRGAIIADLACLMGEQADLQAKLASLQGQQAAMQSRISRMIRDLSCTTAVIPREHAHQIRRETDGSRPEGAASPNAPGTGEGGIGRDAAQGYSADPEAPKDSVSRIGRRNEEVRRDGAGASAEPTGTLGHHDLPLVPRHDPDVLDPGRVQRGGPPVRSELIERDLPKPAPGAAALPKPHAKGDEILDLFGQGLPLRAIADKLAIRKAGPGEVIRAARAAGDERVIRGDQLRAERMARARMEEAPKPAPVPEAVVEPVAAPALAAALAPAPAPKRTIDMVCDLWAETDLSTTEIAQRLSLSVNSPGPYLSTAFRDGDARVSVGDAKRGVTRQAKSRPEPVELPDGVPAVVDLATGEVTGPLGGWKADRQVAKAIGVLTDGRLYGIDRMSEKSGIAVRSIESSMGIWAAALRKIGVDLVHTRGIGCKLNRVAA